MNSYERKRSIYLAEKGWGVIPPDQYLIDIEPEFLRIWETVREFTMTSFERGYALFKATEYIVTRDIPGSFVECGVWKGGSCMLIALTLQSLGVQDRRLYLFDTFHGMTEPCEEDKIAWNNASVLKRWEKQCAGSGKSFASWAVDLQAVRMNMAGTGYPEHMVEYVQGDVAETLYQPIVPDKIALLRLDTDWYESTRLELELLYPLVTEGGVLIIDDYGHFTGARKAVDEYFHAQAHPILLNRIDYTGRIGIKD